MRTFASLAEFVAAKGESLGVSEWHTITQDQVNAFGGTIAHGYLTLSLLPVLQMEIFAIKGLAMGINYGLDRLRFPSPVPVGSSIRAEATLTDVRETPLGSLASVRVRVEVEGQQKAVCVADTLGLYVSA